MIQNTALKIPNLHHYDVEGLCYAQENIARPMKTMLKNSFGFGGINVSCLFRKWE